MTLQTATPLDRMSMQPMTRRADIWGPLRDRHYGSGDPQGSLELDAPYQRGDVWTTDQRRLLIKSLMLGVPIPAIIVNDRGIVAFTHPDGRRDWRYAVVDGKQRVTTLLDFFDSELDVPQSWFAPDARTGGHDSDDGRYVYFADLTRTAQRHIENAPITVIEARLPSLQAEADLFVLLNRGGTHVADDVIDKARTVAAS